MLVQSRESRVNKSPGPSPFIIHAKWGPDMVATKDDLRFSVLAKHGRWENFGKAGILDILRLSWFQPS